MKALRQLVKNPIVLQSPTVLLLLFAGHRLTLASSPINTPASNILTNGGFENLDVSGFPVGWQLVRATDNVTASTPDGFNSPHSLEITNPVSTRTNSTLATPSISVAANKPYFYKGFYKSSLPFDLLLRTVHQDGSSSLT